MVHNRTGRRRVLGILVTTVFLLGASAAGVSAQEDSFDPAALQDRIDPANRGDLGARPVSVQARFVRGATKSRVTLFVTATIEPGWHIYGIDQPDGGPIATEIRLKEPGRFDLQRLETTSPPEISTGKWPTDKSLEVHEHEGSATWVASVKFKTPVKDLSQLEIHGSVYAQACKQSCLPPTDYPFVAKFSKHQGRYINPDINTRVEGYVDARAVAPGESTRLVIKLKPQGEYHVYRLSDRPIEQSGNQPTLFVITGAGDATVGEAQLHGNLVEVEESDGVLSYYDGDLSISVPLTVPEDAEVGGSLSVSGMVGFGACTSAGRCDPATGLTFDVSLPVAAQSAEGQTPLVFHPGNYEDVEYQVGLNAEDKLELSTLLWVIGASLLGGMILNLMPCVLPVIGLKIMSFVQQAGENRTRVLALNLWFTAGLMSVFVALAGLAIFLNLGWGQQFQSTEFNIVMAGLVFIMALSFLGVWEIPIPGFVGRGKANEMAEQEGPGGAFFKGVLSTLLATPCSGPFLGPIFGFTLGKPALLVFAVFGSIGLGMALPYLAIGAFPRLIRFLPTPGAWMETFKQVMGFVLLGTVVFLFTIIDRDYFIAAFTLLIGLWFMCWIIGRVPITATTHRKAAAWASGVTAAVVIGAAAFQYLGPWVPKLPWKPFSTEALAKAQAEGKTVMVDFTADWCLTCKMNLKFAVDTDAVKRIVEQNDVVPLLADWTKPSDEIYETLRTLKSNSIPVLAIYPADSPNRPIILRDVVRQSTVIQKLKEAGPSRPAKSVADPSSAGTELTTKTGRREPMAQH